MQGSVNFYSLCDQWFAWPLSYLVEAPVAEHSAGSLPAFSQAAEWLQFLRELHAPRVAVGTLPCSATWRYQPEGLPAWNSLAVLYDRG